MSTRSSLKVLTLHRCCLLAGILMLASPTTLAATVILPPAGGQYDSQLGGAYPPPDGVSVLSRDRTEPPVPGLYNICYINAFQTQPQELGLWTSLPISVLLTRPDGSIVEDPNWPGEVILDTSTAEKRAALFLVTSQWIAQCARYGFQAIEADNLDTYSRSNGALTVADNLAYASALAAYAHGLGLAFAQKNGVELGQQGKSAGFDFAIVESCQMYAECDAYTDVYGRNVIEIEYTDTDPRFFETACAARGEKISVIRRDRNLTMSGDPSYFYRTC